MENKLNKQALENYARLTSRKLCDDYFSVDKPIGGKDIVRFTSIEQVNYFILKNLFVQWKAETENYKRSPFFDYTHAEVEQAMIALMNVLSNHISIRRINFEILLASAIEETIYLALSPYHYFKQYFFNTEKVKISVAEIKEYSKYIRFNGNFFNDFIRSIESYKMDSFIIADILGYFQQAYYNNNENFDNYDQIINEFNAIYPIDINEIVIDPRKKSDYAPTPLEVYESRQKQTEQVKATVANNLKPIKLGLNQRIMFLKELFNGDQDQMEHTLARLESAGNLENARYILTFFNWDSENEVVQEFYELVEAKYK